MRRRVVEVYSHWPTHEVGQCEWSCGSGYALGGRLVLTAAHIVCRGNRLPEAVTIRAVGNPRLLKTKVEWQKCDDHLDAALLLVVDDDWRPPNGASHVRWGKLVTRQPGVPCEATGFPEVVATPVRRDTEQASGTINPGALTKSGLLSIRIDSPPEQVVADETSPWGGMSGSAVFCGELLTGIVVQDPAGFNSRRLVAVSIVNFSTDEEFVGLVAEHTGRDLVLEAVEFAALALPPMRADSPASLLRADIAPMRFRDRPEIEALFAWAESGGPVSVRLLHGPGGQGKTRLARHVAAKLAANGWATLLISDTAPLEQMTILKSAIVPTFIVVDYAESRAYQLGTLAGIIMNAEERVRVLLLARTPGSWQARLATISAYATIFSNAPGSGLGSLETEVSGRQEAWMEAVESLAVHLSRLEGYQDVSWLQISKQLTPPALNSERYGTILAVQEDALAAILRLRPPEVEQRQALRKSFKLGQLPTRRSVQHVGPSSRAFRQHTGFTTASPALTIMDCFNSTTRRTSGGLGLAYPSMTRLSRTTHSWSLQTNGRRFPPADRWAGHPPGRHPRSRDITTTTGLHGQGGPERFHR